MLVATGARSIGAACGLALAAWLFAATLIELAERVRLFARAAAGGVCGARCACRAPPGA